MFVGMRVWITAALLAAVLVSCGGRPPAETTAAAKKEAAEAPAPPPGPSFGDSFWAHWGDGQAEIASYDLTIPRYRETRKGTAVAIFVTETFSNELRVKADPGEHPEADEVSVMKLNLVEDYPTGIYDYNVMTSAWSTLEPAIGRPAGAALKVSFSAQEWCGHVYSQLLFDPRSVRRTSHSYFDGKADQSGELNFPADGLPEDLLWQWARGFAGPALEPGESAKAQILPALKRQRSDGAKAEWMQATLTRSADVETITVPAGEIVTERWTATFADGFERTFFVERQAPRRIVKWQTSAGESAELIASERVQYWRLNGKDGDAPIDEAIQNLGLSKRPPRTM